MDYLPRRESEFNNWETNFLNLLKTHQADFGLTGEELAALSNMQSSWQAAYSAHLNAQSAAQGARQKKDNLCKDYQSALRRMVRKLQVNDKVTEDQKVSLGITVPTFSRTRVGPPINRPIARIEMGQRLQHTIHFMDEATPNRRGKPSGVSGCEIWLRLGDNPAKNPKEYLLLDVSSASPYVAKHEDSAGGEIAHYMLRWKNRRGDRGPWSQVYSATVQP